MADNLLGKRPAIEITMFGTFSIRAGKKVLSDSDGRSKMLWNLLGYLIANRWRDIPQEQLIENLWEEADMGADPQNSLKNLVYRLRNLLRPLGEDTQHPFIVLKRNSYAWNNALDCRIDTEEFERLYKAAFVEPDGKARIRLYQQTVDLYQGDFLPKFPETDWVIASNTYYKTTYLKCVKSLSDLLCANGRYDEASLLCEKAAMAEPYDESVHELLIRSYLAAGRRPEAIRHYEYITELFYNNLGVSLSEKLRSLMREVIRQANGVENDFAIIRLDLRESEQINGAFFCDYEIFKHIYRLEARMAERFGQSVFVVLLTFEPSQRNTQPEIAMAMRALKDALRAGLRKSDVVARFSHTQYILMLPSLTFENGQKVVRRIVDKFEAQNNHPPIRLSIALHPISPIESPQT